MSEIVYRGVRHTDVIAQNTTEGKRILGIYHSQDSQFETYKIVTDLADGLTVLTDELIYTLDGLLQTWRVFHRGGKTYLLFDRSKYDYYLSYHRTKEESNHAQ